MANKFNANKDKKSGYDSKVEKFIAEQFGKFIEIGVITGFQRCRWHFEIIPELSHINEYDEEYFTPKRHERRVRHVVKKVVDEHAASYTPDFIFYDNETNEWVALEIKSFITMSQSDYKIRRKLFKHIIAKHNAKGRSQWRFDEIRM